jgi:hypothetical protein
MRLIITASVCVVLGAVFFALLSLPFDLRSQNSVAQLLSDALRDRRAVVVDVSTEDSAWWRDVISSKRLLDVRVGKGRTTFVGSANVSDWTRGVKATHTIESMSGNHFLHRLEAGDCVYGTVPLQDQELHRIADFPLDNAHSALWMSTRLVVTHAHFDRSMNVLQQLQGTKRLRLMGPNASVPIYPSCHAHYHQIHDGVDTESWQTLDLHAGQALVIPPYVFHHVSCLSPVCVSVSHHARSDEELVFHDALKSAEQLSADQLLSLASSDELCALYRTRWSKLGSFDCSSEMLLLASAAEATTSEAAVKRILGQLSTDSNVYRIVLWDVIERSLARKTSEECLGFLFQQKCS